METIAITVASVAIGLAIIIAIKNAVTGRRKNVSQENAPSAVAALGTMAAARTTLGVKPEGPPPPMPPMKKRVNKRGWRAPAGHYFNDRDELFTDAGDLILEMMMVAQLCGEQYDGDVIDEVVPVMEIEEPVGTETIASRPEPVVSEVTPSSSFSDLQTDRVASVHSEPASYSDGSDSYDSDGGDCGGGDD